MKMNNGLKIGAFALMLAVAPASLAAAADAEYRVVDEQQTVIVEPGTAGETTVIEREVYRESTGTLLEPTGGVSQSRPSSRVNPYNWDESVLKINSGPYGPNRVNNAGNGGHRQNKDN